jgi:hypothetical protein
VPLAKEKEITLSRSKGGHRCSSRVREFECIRVGDGGFCFLLERDSDKGVFNYVSSPSRSVSDQREQSNRGQSGRLWRTATH